MAALAAATDPRRAPARPRLQAVGFHIDDALDGFCSYLRSPVTGQRSPVTVATYRHHVEKLAAFLKAQGMPQDVGLVTREHIEAYFQHLATNVPNRKGGMGVQPATLSVAFRSIRPFWKWLVEEGEINHDPMARMVQPKVPEDPKHHVTGDEVRSLLATCAGNSFEDTRDAAIISLLFARGLRRGELAALAVEDLNIAHGTITVRGTTSKSRRTRTISFGAEAERRLQRYLRRRSRHPNADLPALWLQSRRGHGWQRDPRDSDLTAPAGGITGNGILQMLRRRARQAGLSGIYAHAFRHGFIAAALDGGMSEEAVMRQTGHQDVNMIRRVYGARAAQDRANRVAREYDPLDLLVRARR